jgi:hypothetical protein
MRALAASKPTSHPAPTPSTPSYERPTCAPYELRREADLSQVCVLVGDGARVCIYGSRQGRSDPEDSNMFQGGRAGDIATAPSPPIFSRYDNPGLHLLG